MPISRPAVDIRLEIDGGVNTANIAEIAGQVWMLSLPALRSMARARIAIRTVTTPSSAFCVLSWQEFECRCREQGKVSVRPALPGACKNVWTAQKSIG